MLGNWVDLALIFFVAYFVLTQNGFIFTMLEAISFFVSLVISYKFYTIIGGFLISYFTLPRGIANAGGFFLVWFFSEMILSVLIHYVVRKFFFRYQHHPLNTIFGVVAAGFQAFAIFLFLVAFIFAFPVRGQFKQAILNSRTGPYFVDLSRSVEKQLKSVFGEAVNETLNFLTVKPQSNESVDLGFQTEENQLSLDPQSESVMFEKINEERKKRGIHKLEFAQNLSDVARDYAKEMFTHGFFAHVSAVDRSTPADRVERAGIDYLVIGENLAFAPDVYDAHEGLMNSEGHRKNILSEDYGKVGIGVVDGGVYGKMFVQEFTNE